MFSFENVKNVTMEIITSVAIFTGPLPSLLVLGGRQAGKRSTSFSESARCSPQKDDKFRFDSTSRAVPIKSLGSRLKYFLIIIRPEHGQQQRAWHQFGVIISWTPTYLHVTEDCLLPVPDQAYVFHPPYSCNDDGDARCVVGWHTFAHRFTEFRLRHSKTANSYSKCVTGEMRRMDFWN